MRNLFIVLLFLFVALPAYAEFGFSEKYERDYNIFNPASRYAPDNPLNLAQAYTPDNPFSPANRYDPGNPTNPANQYSPNNPFNPANQYKDAYIGWRCSSARKTSSTACASLGSLAAWTTQPPSQ
jgi:hypothetical protein